MVGTWKVDVTQTKDPAQEATRHEGLVVVEPVAGGRYVRARMRTDNGGPDDLQVYTFDRDSWEFGGFYFNRDGVALGQGVGRFDAAARTLTLAAQPAAGTVGVKTVHCPDPDTITWDVAFRDPDGKATVDMRGRMTRTPAGPAFAEAASPGLPAEMSVLDRLAGTWDMDWVERSNPADTRKAEMVGAKVLGGRFVEVRERVLPSGEENYFLYTFDPAKKAYRMWHFSSRWPMSEGIGSWDAGAKAMAWTTESGPMKGSRMTWRFVSDGRTEFHMAVVGEGGNPLADLEGTHARRK